MEQYRDIERIDQLIVLFMQGAITEDGLKELRTWDAASIENHAYVAHHIKELYALESYENPLGFDEDGAFQSFMKRTGNSVRGRHLWMYIALTAASLLLLIIPGYWLYNHIPSNRLQQEVCMCIPEGSTLEITLPDSTKVSLSGGSVLSYSQDFGILHRDVKFSGMGYFKVHHAQKPFRVITKELTIQDIGTEFLVQNYPADTMAKVSLFEGSVSLHNNLRNNCAFVMKEGDCIVLNKHDGRMNLLRGTKGGSSDMINDIYFENTRVTDIASILNRYYGVHVKVSQQLSKKRFYGYFNRKEDSLEDIIQSICSVCHLRYAKSGRKYVIY